VKDYAHYATMHYITMYVQKVRIQTEQ